MKNGTPPPARYCRLTARMNTRTPNQANSAVHAHTTTED
jgi:hypothetical protein